MAIFRCGATADSSLYLFIDWLAKDKLIHFDTDSRFVKNNDNSMTITNTIELDSGIYTCVARTVLDNVTSSAMLIVQVCNHH